MHMMECVNRTCDSPFPFPVNEICYTFLFRVINSRMKHACVAKRIFHISSYIWIEKPDILLRKLKSRFIIVMLKIKVNNCQIILVVRF